MKPEYQALAEGLLYAMQEREQSGHYGYMNIVEYRQLYNLDYRDVFYAAKELVSEGYAEYRGTNNESNIYLTDKGRRFTSWQKEQRKINKNRSSQFIKNWPKKYVVWSMVISTVLGSMIYSAIQSLCHRDSKRSEIRQSIQHQRKVPKKSAPNSDTSVHH